MCETGNEGALYGICPLRIICGWLACVGMGITKIPWSGGEPLLRNGIVVEFVRELAKLRAQGLKPSAGANGTAKAVPFPTPSLEIALTNGHLLADLAKPRRYAGLNRVTVSMDAVDPDRFARITRVPNGYDHVLAGIRAARRAGLGPVKVNCVLMRGFNEDQIIPFGMFAREEDVCRRALSSSRPLEEGRTWSLPPWSRWMRFWPVCPSTCR